MRFCSVGHGCPRPVYKPLGLTFIVRTRKKYLFSQFVFFHFLFINLQISYKFSVYFLFPFILMLFSFIVDFLKFFFIVQLYCLPLSPIPLPCSTYPHLPHSILTPIVFVHVSFTHVPWWPFPFFPPLPPPCSPLVTVSLFFISVSLVLFCSFVCFVD